MSPRPAADRACPACRGDGGRFVVVAKRSRWQDCETCGGTGVKGTRLTDRGVAALGVLLIAFAVALSLVTDWGGPL